MEVLGRGRQLREREREGESFQGCLLMVRYSRVTTKKVVRKIIHVPENVRWRNVL